MLDLFEVLFHVDCVLGVQVERADLFDLCLFDELFEHVRYGFLSLLLIILSLFLLFVSLALLGLDLVVNYRALLVCIENFIVATQLGFTLLNFLDIAQQTDVACRIVNVEVLLQIIEDFKFARSEHLVHLKAPF